MASPFSRILSSSLADILARKNVAQNGREQAVKILGYTVSKCSQRFIFGPFEQFFFGVFLFCDVFQGFHGAEYAAA